MEIIGANQDRNRKWVLLLAACSSNENSSSSYLLRKVRRFERLEAEDINNNTIYFAAILTVGVIIYLTNIWKKNQAKILIINSR